MSEGRGLDSESWALRLERGLADAGIEARRARRLAEESVAEARDYAQPPEEVYGPAEAYARELARAARAAVRGERRSDGPHSGAPVLRLRDVSKRYGRKTVVRDVSLELKSGQIGAVVGANGSGKSTLLKICAGLVRATSGSVERVENVGYVPQAGGLSPLLTASEHFRLFGSLDGKNERESLVAGTRLAQSLGWRPSRKLGAARLSGGTQQKLNVVLGGINRPRLILLDEPYQGFDQGTYTDFWEQLFSWREAGAGVLVVTHILHDLDGVDWTCELHPQEES
mgnify:FL=1